MTGPRPSPVGSSLPAVETGRTLLSIPLDPKQLEDRLFRIEIVMRSDFATDYDAFVRIKQMIFDLRLDIARAASRDR